MIYVDDMRAKVGFFVLCHMIGDSNEELHEMARRIGIARRWFQGDHYDISMSKRSLAVAAGAREITLRQAARMAGIQRRTGYLPTPEEIAAARPPALPCPHDEWLDRGAGAICHSGDETSLFKIEVCGVCGGKRDVLVGRFPI